MWLSSFSFVIFLTTKGEAAFARVDCEQEAQLCIDHKINKYPTIKLLKYGQMMKREYRGARTVEALSKHIKESLVINMTVVDAHMQDPLKLIANITEPQNTIVAIFQRMDASSQHYQYIRRTAHLLQDNCAFYVIHNVSPAEDRLAYKVAVVQAVKEITVLKGANFKAVYSWVVSRCVPPVRELTFQNAEEITEEGLPLMLLFYDQRSVGLKALFHELVADHFQKEKEQINFLTADGSQFSHPLSHLNKGPKDLPLFAVDSLVHMYLHPLSPQEVLHDPEIMRKFILDLHSGKLHREFHYGPDPVPKIEADKKPEQKSNDPTTPTIPTKMHEGGDTDPPESVFRNLGPSPRKYTILHDEF